MLITLFAKIKKKFSLMDNTRNDPNQMTRHHRKPQKLGGSNDSKNISYISREAHEAWHLLFNHQDAAEIARIISDIYLDPDYIFVPCRKTIAGC